MSGEVIHVGDADFRREVLESSEPVLVDFTATWCPPCRAIAPVLDALAVDYRGRVKIAKLDVDLNQATSEAYGIRAMPTLLVFKAGRVVQQIVGAVPRAKLEAALHQVSSS